MTWRSSRLQFAVATVLALLAIRGVVTAAARADEPLDRLKARATNALRHPGIASPYPCDDGWAASAADNRVVDVTPWMEAAGLKRGDRFVAIAGAS